MHANTGVWKGLVSHAQASACEEAFPVEEDDCLGTPDAADEYDVVDPDFEASMGPEDGPSTHEASVPEPPPMLDEAVLAGAPSTQAPSLQCSAAAHSALPLHRRAHVFPRMVSLEGQLSWHPQPNTVARPSAAAWS